MGLANCSCSLASEGELDAPPIGKALGGVPATGSNFAPRIGGHLAGGAAASFYVAKGQVVSLRWVKGEDPMAPPVLLPETLSVPAKVERIAAGEAHALLLTIDPVCRVFSMGANESGQLGLGDTHARAARCWEVPELRPDMCVSDVACGGHVSMAISKRGTCWSWGRNEASGVLGHGPMLASCVSQPMVVANLRSKVRAVQVATTGIASFCVSHLGKLFSWGSGLCGVHGQGHQEDEFVVKAVRALEGVQTVQVACGALHTLGLDCNGVVYAWGKVSGAFGMEAQLQLNPKVIDALEGSRIIQVAAGEDHSLAVSDKGEVFAWGKHDDGQLGDPGLCVQPHALVHPLAVAAGSVREVACGKYHSLLRAPHGDLWLFGQAAAPGDHIGVRWDGYGPRHRTMAAPKGKFLEPTRVNAKLITQILLDVAEEENDDDLANDLA